MIETQASIIAWADRTFGSAPNLLRIMARANEEMAELVRAVTTDAGPDKIAEEAADVAIVLCRAAAATGNNLTSDVFVGFPMATLPAATRANGFLAFMMERLVPDERISPRNVGVYVPLIVQSLSRLCTGISRDLGAAIDEKMAINRARIWRLDGGGHGYHVADAAQ